MPRPAGSKNKIGSGAKSNIIGVFEKIGGREKMAEWALSNQTEFYRLYGRLVPTEVGIDPENNVLKLIHESK